MQTSIDRPGNREYTLHYKAALLILGLLLSGFLNGQIPVNPNKTDAQNKRQGKWTLWFDNDWKPTVNQDQVQYYRLIEYKDDLPVGEVKDLFKGGELQFSGTLSADRPYDVFIGTCTWYRKDGTKESVSEYADGKATKIYTYYFDGTLITDSASVLYKRGEELYNADKADEALVNFEKAKIRSWFEEGSRSPNYINALYYIGTLSKGKRDYKKAESAFQDYVEVYRKAVGVDHSNYATALHNLATVYYDMDEYAKAEPLFITITGIYAKTLGKENPDYWTTLNKLANIYYYQAEYKKAELLYLEVKEIREKVLGKDHIEYANSVDDLGLVYYQMKEYAKAEPWFVEAKDRWLKLLGKDDPDYATAVNSLGDIYFYLSKYDKAEPLYKEACEIRSRTLGKEHASYCRSLNSLAAVYSNVGDLAKAESGYLELKKIQEKTLGKAHADYAATLKNLGDVNFKKGNYGQAELFFVEAREVTEKILGKKHHEYANSLNDLALVYKVTGRYSKAEPLYQEALEIWGNTLGKGHENYGTCLDNLANLYDEMGNYTKGEQLHLEAMTLTAQALGKEHDTYGVRLNNMAGFYLKMGNLNKAEALYLEAKAIQQKKFGTNNSKYATYLDNLALLYETMGENSKAERMLYEARDIRSKVLGETHPDYAASLITQARYCSKMGKYNDAEALFKQAKVILENKLGKEHPEYASALGNLADLYYNQFEYAKAEPLLLEAKEIQARVLGKDHPSYAGTLNSLSNVYGSNGKNAKAEALHLEAIAQMLQQITRYFPALSENEKLQFLQDRSTYFLSFEIFCLKRYSQNPEILGELYNVKLATKGLLFNSSDKMRQRILRSGNQDLINLFNEWQSKKDFLAKVYQMPLREKKAKGIDEKIIEEEANTLEKRLSQNSEQFSLANENKQFRWQEVQSKLNSDEVAVEMMRTKKWVDRSLVWVYAALIITAKTSLHPDIVVFENGGELEGKFSKYYRNAIKQKINDQLSYQQFWKPIADKLKDVKKVYFSADGVYNQINLNTLYNPATGKYVVDEVEIQVVTSTKELLTSKSSKTVIKDATLFGYPNYNNSKKATPDSSRSLFLEPVAKASEIKGDTSQRFLNGEDINELPGTKVEVETIEALLRKKSIGLHRYMFDEATEAAIKKLSSPQVLHIATHGFFLADLPTPNDNERGFAGMEIKKIAENPLLRSGLLFAGVKNAFAKSGATTNSSGEDGILTAYEAKGLDLDQTDLVVMSACETGLGVTSNGEGVYGLQRSFQVAGAKSVLMSLWTVSDEATQQLMTLFYENWLSGKSLREAFHLAQLSLRNQYPEPYYWGAFVLVGN